MHARTAAVKEVLDFRPGADMVWEIVETEGAFAAVNTVGPGTGGPPLHLHPSAEESYELLEGSMEVCVEGSWRTLAPGDRVVVPAGVPHTVRSHGDAPARVLNVHTPALDYEAFFRDFHRLVSTGAVSLPPTDPRSMVRLAVLFSAYPHLQRSVRPPQAFFGALGRVGRALGVRAG